MKKPILALSALCAASLCAAQSSVTLFGVVDATLARGWGSGPGSSGKLQLTHSGYQTSRLGLRGSEDLGGGLAASFWLEGALQNDDGRGAATNTNNQASGAGTNLAGGQGFTFGRRSTVSLTGSFGELRIGRDFTPHIWTLALMDVFTDNGVGVTQTFSSAAPFAGAAYVRASNSVSYLTPGCSTHGGCVGFWGHAMVYLGENASGSGATARDGDGYSVRFGYGGGPLYLALATSRTRYATGDVDISNVGLQYVMGNATLLAHVAYDKVHSPTPFTGRGGMLGVRYALGASEIRASYSQYRTDQAGHPGSGKLALGYAYHMSKRTTLYATVANLRNRGGAAQALNGAVTARDHASTGLDLGVRHTF